MLALPLRPFDAIAPRISGDWHVEAVLLSDDPKAAVAAALIACVAAVEPNRESMIVLSGRMTGVSVAVSPGKKHVYQNFSRPLAA